jgi:hypothetical protein
LLSFPCTAVRMLVASPLASLFHVNVVLNDADGLAALPFNVYAEVHVLEVVVWFSASYARAGSAKRSVKPAAAGMHQRRTLRVSMPTPPSRSPGR